MNVVYVVYCVSVVCMLCVRGVHRGSFSAMACSTRRPTAQSRAPWAAAVPGPPSFPPQTCTLVAAAKAKQDFEDTSC